MIAEDTLRRAENGKTVQEGELAEASSVEPKLPQMNGLAMRDVCRGHNGKVRSLTWAGNDAHIISCGTEGAVYQWKVKTFKRVRENVLKVHA